MKSETELEELADTTRHVGRALLAIAGFLLVVTIGCVLAYAAVRFDRTLSRIDATLDTLNAHTLPEINGAVADQRTFLKTQTELSGPKAQRALDNLVASSETIARVSSRVETDVVPNLITSSTAIAATSTNVREASAAAVPVVVDTRANLDRAFGDVHELTADVAHQEAASAADLAGMLAEARAHADATGAHLVVITEPAAYEKILAETGTTLENATAITTEARRRLVPPKRELSKNAFVRNALERPGYFLLDTVRASPGIILTVVRLAGG